MMTQWFPERKWILAGLGLVLLLLGAVSYASYQNATRLIASANQVRHTNQVLKTLTDVVATLIDAEAGRRGYFLFGDRQELERYNNAITSVKPKITQLQQLVVNDVNQQQRLVQLTTLIEQRLALYQRSNELFEINNPTPAQEALLAQLRQNQREIRQIIAEIQTEEERLLEQQVNQSQSGFKYRMLFNCESNLVIFEVKDQGIGISSEDLQSLFEPFYRSETVKNVVGSGLGLAVVKTCLDLHQGHVSVESEVGVGTTFTVGIPQGTEIEEP